MLSCPCLLEGGLGDRQGQLPIKCPCPPTPAMQGAASGPLPLHLVVATLGPGSGLPTGRWILWKPWKYRIMRRWFWGPRHGPGQRERWAVEQRHQGRSAPHGECWSGWRPPGKGQRLCILPDKSLDVGGPGRDDLAQRAPLVQSSCQRDAAAAWAVSTRLLPHKPWSSGHSSHPRGTHSTWENSSSWALVEPFSRGHLTEQAGGEHSMPPPLAPSPLVSKGKRTASHPVGRVTSLSSCWSPGTRRLELLGGGGGGQLGELLLCLVKVILSGTRSCVDRRTSSPYLIAGSAGGRDLPVFPPLDS